MIHTVRRCQAMNALPLLYFAHSRRFVPFRLIPCLSPSISFYPSGFVRDTQGAPRAPAPGPGYYPSQGPLIWNPIQMLPSVFIHGPGQGAAASRGDPLGLSARPRKQAGSACGRPEQAPEASG